MSSDSDIAGDLVEEGPPPAAAAARKRKRPEVAQGPHRLCVVTTSADGLWPVRPSGADLDYLVQPGEALIVGFVIVRWEWLSLKEAVVADRWFEQQLRQESRAQQLYGFIAYRVLKASSLEVVAVASGASVADISAALGNSVVRVYQDGSNVYQPAQQMMQSWRDEYNALPGTIVANLSPWLASQIVSGSKAHMHMVAATGRTRRAALLVRAEPSRRQLRALCEKADGERAALAPEAVVPVRHRQHELTLQPECVLEWLEATATVRDIRKVPAAALAFGKIFTRQLRAQQPELKVEAPTVGYETLRLARVRADCVAMKLHRRFIQALGETAQIYIYCDASPQLRGIELFATTFDIFDGVGFHRRLAPVISLERTHYDALGKMTALLWQIWLMAGPKAEDVARFCGRVRALVTDQGTERMLANMPDTLGDFWRMMPESGEPPPPRGFTFPRALEVPGWMHLWDTVLRRSLSSLSFFPEWMSRTRALVAFLRSAPLRSQLAKLITSAGRPAIAEMVLALKLPTIATWRWKTLAEVCRALEPAIQTLKQNFDATPFKNTRDLSRLTRVEAALTDEDWYKQFRFVLWLTSWLTSIMTWIGGCDCHPRQQGQPDPAGAACPRKGRRLKHAYAVAELERGLAEANGWQPQHFELGEIVWQELQGCVRHSVHLAHQKIRFLNEVPYLLVRLDQPGVRDECMAQWLKCAPDKHHRITREFLAEESPLRSEVDALAVDGSNCSEVLAAELRGFEEIPLDDTVAESPHARAKRILEHSKGSSWPWTAATMRLAQNLQDIKELVPLFGESLPALWGKYKTILQVNPSKATRNLKVKKKVFSNRLYHMSHFIRTNSDVAPALCDADAPADPALPMPPPVPGIEAPPIGNLGIAPQKDPSVLLMRQYFREAFTPMSYVSVPILTDDGFAPHFFQVLRLGPRAIAPKTFEVDRDELLDPVLFEVGGQPLQRWAPLSQDPAHLGEAADVFIFDDAPSTIDILRSCGVNPGNRHMFLEWKARQSDVDGCIGLHSPKVVRPNLALSAPHVPCLMLVDALHANGFGAVDSSVVHAEGSPKVFDGRKLASKRNYLKCVLAGPELFLAGVAEFQSTHASAWFAYLLKFKRTPQLGMNSRALMEAIGDEDGQETYEALGPAQAMDMELAVIGDGGVSDPDIAGDDLALPAAPEQPEVPAPEQPPPPLPAPDDGDDIVGDEPQEARLAWPEVLEGVRVHVVKGRHQGGYSYYDRLQVTCPNPQHSRCQKSRSTLKQVNQVGPRAAVGYLGAWLLRAHDLSEAEHRRYDPSMDDVRAYLMEG